LQLSVIIVHWNTCQLLDRCLNTLSKELQALNLFNTGSEVFVVDNNSADGSATTVANNHPWVKLIANKENLGFARANNQALQLASGKYILLLNPDTEIYSGALGSLIAFLDHHHRAGIVAPQLINTNGSIQASCRTFPSFKGLFYELIGLSRLMPPGSSTRNYKMLDWGHDDERQVDQPEGACLLIRKELFSQIGLFDEGFFMLFEEVDWCYRAKQAGWEIWFTPNAKVLHHLGQAINQVKTKMILSSHRGLYRYWYKHHRHSRKYLDAIVYGALMGLAYFRIASYSIKRSLLAPETTHT
jgi:GT2 family glycosyltransferase